MTLNGVWDAFILGSPELLKSFEVPAHTSSHAQKSLLKVTFVRLYTSLVSLGYLRGAQVAKQGKSKLGQVLRRHPQCADFV